MALLLVPSKIYYSLLSLATLVLTLYVTPTTGDDPLYQICGTNGKFTANSTFQSNLQTLLPSLSSNGSLSGYSTAAVGGTPDEVYGLILCRGDTNATLCRSCLDTAGPDILQLCPYDKDAAIWYERCLLRYSNQRFISSEDYSPSFYMWAVLNVSDPGRFNDGQFYDRVEELMDRISQCAAYNSSRRFATGEVDYSAKFPKIYGLTQCTPDLSIDQCRRCLKGLTDQIRTKFFGRRGGRILGVRCNFRFEVGSFYDGASTLVLSSSPSTNNTHSPPPALLPNQETGKENNTGTSVLVIVLPIIGVSVLLLVIYDCFKRRKTNRRKNNGLIDDDMTTPRAILFDLSTLRDATDNFSDATKLGQGGFGPVCKGVLADGQQIAVKRLSRKSKQGIEELINEVKLVAKLQHKNLVTLLGYYLGEIEKLLIYEFLPNGSLDEFLYSKRSHQREPLDWHTRYKIIKGIGRGLLYLHEVSRLKIIHRDLKPSNILLDGNMNPKISDFGLARLFDVDQTHKTTCRIAGTYGYMSPEYTRYKQFSTSSDVYSYGVLVLEIVTGRKNSDFDTPDHAAGLLGHAWKLWNEDKALELLDQSVSKECPLDEVVRCIHIGLLCVQDDPTKRPSMASVVPMFSAHQITAPSPSAPGYYRPEGVTGSVNHASITEMQPR